MTNSTINGSVNKIEGPPPPSNHDIHATSTPPTLAKLQAKFIIVGGGIAGLSCAIALRRVGHRVTVVERDPSISNAKSAPNKGGCRMAPNLSKILYHWGLKESLDDIAFISQGIDILLYETGELLGTHIWDEEMLREARGEFIFAYYTDIQHLLYTTALSYGADVRLGTNVTSIDPEASSITLENGDILKADVLVCADGVQGIGRKLLDDTETNEADMMMYCATIPKSEIMKDTDLRYFYCQTKKSMFSWFGDQCCVLAMPLGCQEDLSLFVYGPASGHRIGTYLETDAQNLKNMQKILETAEPRLRKLGQLAPPPACLPYSDSHVLDDWVHESGSTVVIGEAAHPLPPGGIHILAMAVEDGAVLAKLFSHLLSFDQIPSFLYAFEDLRRSRCAAVQTKEKVDIGFMMMSPGVEQEGRDTIFRAKRDRGLSPLAAVDLTKFDQGELYEIEEETPLWREAKEIFGYDAEDEADNWWQEWGLLRERSMGRFLVDETLDKFVVQHSMKLQVGDVKP